MRKILLLLSLVFLINIAFCQNADIEHIRKVYYKAVDDIKKSREEGYEGSLYCNTQETNKYGKSWRAVGNYNEKVEFWYDDDPGHHEENPAEVLYMVIVTGESAAYGYYKEFVFENGKLIFAFEKYRNEEEPDELRYYYKNEELIKRVVNKDELENDESKYTLGEANNRKALFLKSFGL